MSGHPLRTKLLTLLGAASLLLCASWLSPADGTVTGVVAAVGGPASIGVQGRRPIAGMVTIHGENGKTFKVDAGANGKFSARVPVGRYTVSGKCNPPQTATVTENATARVDLICTER